MDSVAIGTTATPLLTEHDVIRDETCVLHSPSNPTPTETFFLSNIDQLAAFPVGTLYFYAGGGSVSLSDDDVVDRVKRAVSEKLLIRYYFMAGRLCFNPETKRLELVCNNAGAWFAGATSDRSLKELGDLSMPNASFGHLVLPIDRCCSPIESPIFTIQVTKFKCGGFSIGFMTSHSILDGRSAVRMFETIAAFCRGDEHFEFPELYVDRSCLKARDPPHIKFEHAEYAMLSGAAANSFTSFHQPDAPSSPMPEENEYRTLHLTAAMIDALKAHVPTKCSTFEAVVAHLWRARTRAIFDDDDLSAPSSVLFAVDIRSKLSPPLPDGFVGNAVTTTEARAAAGELGEWPLRFVVERVREAIQRVTDEYVRSAVDWLEVHKGVPSVAAGRSFYVSAWWKLAFHELDFGWGKALYGGPVVSGMPEFVLLLSDGSGDVGKRAGINVWIALPPEKMKRFLRYVYEI